MSQKNTMSQADKLKALDKAIQSINNRKNLKSDVSDRIIAKLNESTHDVETISTGSLVLDSLLGGGLARGRIVEIYGPEASGKTSLALTAVGNVQKRGGTAAFIDLENALDPRYARVLGVDTDNLYLSQPEYAEQAFELIIQLVQSTFVDIIVLDSLAALVPKAELEGDMEDQHVGLQARIISRALRKLVGLCNQTGTTLILINQLRDKVGGFSSFGTPETTTGGRSVKFYASQRIDIRRKETLKEGDKAYGTRVKIRIAKNKIAPPFRSGETVLTFGQGIYKPTEIIESGVELGILERPNSRTWVEVATGEVIGKSRQEATDRIIADEKLQDRLYAAYEKIVSDKLEKGEDIDVITGDAKEEES